ncbi:hypothetical protein AVEN_181524-1 [Araneus ventricosus]|uniref:Uncharacterized protein n=1 Tax=Araneus ventricosus TaxID=182803 RepID=A0A4Y2F1N4_ARAVE|nr:hypothetical protein AVEN_181524-1 [Araneus ventricosus]
MMYGTTGMSNWKPGHDSGAMADCRVNFRWVIGNQQARYTRNADENVSLEIHGTVRRLAFAREEICSARKQDDFRIPKFWP